eukprot:m.98821 g.98821  ORF g.98821 m.98821 type:complete len:137 (+) comp13649_c0_seq4:270-680(+)
MPSRSNPCKKFVDAVLTPEAWLFSFCITMILTSLEVRGAGSLSPQFMYDFFAFLCIAISRPGTERRASWPFYHGYFKPTSVIAIVLLLLKVLFEVILCLQLEDVINIPWSVVAIPLILFLLAASITLICVVRDPYV